MSELAYIHPDAKIGKGTKIDPFVTIEGDVEIGENCWIGSNSVIFNGARIGNNVQIFPGVIVSAIPQDLKFDGEYTLTHVGDNTTLREYVTINRGTADQMETRIGKHCLIMTYVHVAHDCLIGDHCIIANSVALAGHSIIEDHCVLEGLVAVQQFIRIGKYSFIAGTSKVRKNVPPFVKAAREPLSYVGINAIGMRRRGISDEVITRIEDIYRVIYVQNQNTSKAIGLVEKELPNSPEKDYILDFIRDSKKGIMRGNL
ncbi:MAG TPA: acyl-[acyl-carrier-protein]--UDP-N-acetylglucosamine O-acyltransferase [Flavobacteriales bacterium]|jgi:UDP-N-acetylglucosamine acyltransferase|nr:acyl-[acyl-carrier-protein]--UDP-N-acetylglucosamine O-acyltransferase [Flavobacteriales bacterium]